MKKIVLEMFVRLFLPALLVSALVVSFQKCHAQKVSSMTEKSTLTSTVFDSSAISFARYNITTHAFDSTFRMRYKNIRTYMQGSIVSSQWITSGSFIYYNTGAVGIGTGTVSPTANLQVSTTHTTLSTYALKVYNGAGLLMSSVADDGEHVFASNTYNSHVNVFTCKDGNGDNVFGVGDDGVIFLGKNWYGVLPAPTVNQGWLQIGGATSNCSFHIKGYSSYDLQRWTSGAGNMLGCITSGGYLGVNTGTVVPVSPLQLGGIPTYSTNAAAISGGMTAGAVYYTDAAGEYLLKIVHYWDSDLFDEEYFYVRKNKYKQF